MMEKTLDKNKVILGLSGGVDSTAAALLLQQQGYEVIGMFFDIHPQLDEKNIVEGIGDNQRMTDRSRAESAARQLGIKFVYRNVADEFESVVIQDFCRAYAAGRTPNPCIVCNPAVKFRTLLNVADEMGAYHIATGHYADTYHDEKADRWYIKQAANEKKDQSYMLYRLGQEAISRLLLPLNQIDNKDKVRQLAREKALDNADVKDSQEICFIDAEDNYKDFLHRRGISSPKGHFVDGKGNVLGQHQGILNYTIGQRKGLGIALGKPAFVTKLDGKKNQVVLGNNTDLFDFEVASTENILLGREINDGQGLGIIGFDDITAKIRYAAKPASARIELLEDGRVITTFTEPQRAATPGQSIVFYKDELVIGGGFIE